MKTLGEIRRERREAGENDWEFDYIDTAEIMNSKIEEFDARFTEPEEDYENYRAEKFVKFRKTKQVFCTRTAESPESKGISEYFEEWYQRGFGGTVYIGASEAEAFEQFDETMDEREEAFHEFSKSFAMT